MQENDKSFQSFILSLVVHAALILLLFQFETLPPRTPNQPVEIEIKTADKNSEKFYSPPLKAPDLLKKLNSEEEAKFLSSLEQRVEKQTISPKLGEARNQNKFQPKKTLSKLDAKTFSGFNNYSLPRQQTPYTQDLDSQFDMDIKRIQKGTLTLLNSDYNLFASFYDRVSPQVRYHWVEGVTNYISDRVIFELLRINKDEWTTKAEVILDKNGNLIKTIIINSSGSKQLDQPIIDAFSKATPFVNPPMGLVQEDGKIHLYYVFSLRFNPQYFVRTK